MEKLKDKNKVKYTVDYQNQCFRKNFIRNIKISLIFTPVITSAILINYGLLKKNKWNIFLNKSNFPMIKKYSINIFLALSCMGVINSWSMFGFKKELSTKELKENYIKQFPKKDEK